ncbi:hypothetical protein AA12717_0265 [Gluconacetobacter sacchari DSM 12717]|uniref:Uncharacterized protein n=2 Tax=Gluconacetobacter sacchari TaxID=92759 RepID=A0A7W4IAK8_9PROT|nr:hypothetical protein [Gluconacetobacter sacchari]MBB2159351.1 hypothetical protein [Gluconacetobacter sacchari]GBQ19486.1 hypothetical protein AA12717_0265 [Gluconacetobacter sacchari DSM 12717]
MSETLEAPAVQASTDAPGDRFADVQFGSEGDGRAVPNSSLEESAPELPPAPSTEDQPASDSEKPQEPSWYLHRVGSLTKKYRDAERLAAEREQENAELRRALSASRGEAPEPAAETPDQIRAQERQRYEQQAQAQRDAQAFGTATARVAESLTALHGREAIQTATNDLVTKAGLDFDNSGHRQVIADIADLPNAGAVYYALAQDPAKAAELLEAPERKQFAILQRFADSVGAAPRKPEKASAVLAPQISQAPPPVAASAGGGRAVSGRSIYDADLSTEDYVRLRSKK